MNQMGRPLFNREYAYEENKQIGQDSFIYHVTLLIPKISPCEGKLSNQK